MYAYAGNDPVNSRDPSGLKKCFENNGGEIGDGVARTREVPCPRPFLNLVWQYVGGISDLFWNDPAPQGQDLRDEEKGKCGSQSSSLAKFANNTALTLYGMADAATLGYFSELSELLPGVNINRQALSYETGLYGTSAVSFVRLLYSGSVSAIRHIPNITAQKAVGIRNSIKGFFSGLGGGHPRSYSFDQIASRYGYNERAIINASSRTNSTLNATGAATAISSSKAISKINDGSIDNAQCN